MKLKNISTEEQKVMPSDGSASFSCKPGDESPDLSDVCAQQLVADLPTVWAAATSKKKSKKEI